MPFRLCHGLALLGINLSLTPYAMKLIIDRVSDVGEEGSLYYAVMFPVLLYISLGVILGVFFVFMIGWQLKPFPVCKWKSQKKCLIMSKSILIAIFNKIFPEV